MKDKILNLKKKEGLTHKEIAAILNCSSSTVSYYCNEGYKNLHAKRCYDRKKQRKINAINYKGGKCIKCGYSKSSNALQFHHRNPEEKDPNFRKLMATRSANIELLKKELDKCDLLCANCHAEEHERLQENDHSDYS